MNDANKLWSIIFEDESIIVVHKMSGIATESANLRTTDLVSELRKYVKRKGSSYIGLIHRLDQPVEGILVFAKTNEAAASLSRQVTFSESVNNSSGKSKQNDSGRSSKKSSVTNKKMEKLYEAVIYGHLPNESGRLVDYLIKDSKTNTSKVVSKVQKEANNKLVKEAILDYEVVEKNEETELVRINLKTGRHHQIRVQLANAGCPLLGDTKYGTEASIAYSEANAVKAVKLKAYKLSFEHPVTKELMTFEI